MTTVTASADGSGEKHARGKCVKQLPPRMREVGGTFGFNVLHAIGKLSLSITYKDVSFLGVKIYIYTMFLARPERPCENESVQK